MKILVVDDEKSFTDKQSEWLAKEGYESIKAYSEKEANELLSTNGDDIGVALIDMYMEAKKNSGLKLVRLIRQSYPWIVSIVVTGHADFENAARCMEEGCFSYIVKGETTTDMIRQVIRKAVYQHIFLTVLPRLISGLKELQNQCLDFGNKTKQISSTIQRIEDEILFITPKK